MDKLIVEGGRELAGSVGVCGSKNAVLPVMAASLLAEGELTVPNAPRLADVRTMLAVLAELGVGCDQDPSGALHLSGDGPIQPVAGWDNVRKMRGSVCVLGPLLARCGSAKVSLPGAACSACGRSTSTSRGSRPWAPVCGSSTAS